jgi:hypothetical protein
MIVKASTAADFLASVPSLVGFTPSNSVVLVAFRGKRTCGAIRFDVPRTDSKTVRSRVAATMIGTVCKLPAVDAVAVIVYTNETFSGGSVAPQLELAKVLQRRIEQSGFELRASLCQAGDGWASFLHPFPPGGHDLSEVIESAFADALPVDSRPSGGDQHGEGNVPQADPERIRVFTAAADRLIGFIDHYPLDDREVGHDLDPLGDIPLFAENALEWNRAEIEHWGPLLVASVQGPPMRDHVMLQWASTLEIGDSLFDLALGEDGSQTTHPEHFTDLMFGVRPRPDPQRIKRGIALLRHLLALTEGRRRLPLLTMLAWLNWALGHGTTAGRFIEEAVAIDSAYGMAEVLSTLFFNYPLPEWAFE